jgi:uncharacterized protein YkwD
MRTVCFVFLVLSGIQSSLAQAIASIPKDLLAKANTTENVSYLTEDEKKVILYMNLARINGPWFVKNILNENLSGNYTAGNVSSLIKTLNQTKNLTPLKPAEGLSKAATFHAKDMGKAGTIGHNSSDGTNTFVRVRKYAKGGYMSENCSYAPSDPLAIVLQLLVDDGVPSLGHRNTILSEKYTHVGVAIEPHKIYGHNCVQDFSDTGD